MGDDVVAKYHEALGGRRFETARSLLKDDLQFKGPFEEFQSADDYVKAIQGLWHIVESVDIKHMSSYGEEVVVLYDMATNTPAGTQLVCEWYGVENGKIAWIRALFDSARSPSCARRNRQSSTDAKSTVATLRLTQVIGRPVVDVFDAVIEAGTFASWNPTIKSSRQVTPGEIGEGTRFEWELRGFGRVPQELREFERDRRVRIVPEIKSIAGGHRFTFTDLGSRTRVEHELEMTPKGLFKLMAPMMTIIGRRNLRATASALQRHLEGSWEGTEQAEPRQRLPRGMDRAARVRPLPVLGSAWAVG